MKKLLGIWSKLCVGLFVSMFLIGVPTAQAVSYLPDSVYISQNENDTCTLACAAMMLRSRAFLSGYNAWDDITENAIRSTAWNPGLRYNFTYSFDGNSISVKYIAKSGVSLSALKDILDDNPEGIVLYCGNFPHAVFVTDYSGDTVYCADPAGNYAGERISLGNSWMGQSRNYGSQTNILSHVTGYWYVSSYEIRTIPRKNVLSGVYVIHSARNDNYVLDIYQNSKANDANIQLYEKQENSSVQKFRIIKWDNDYYCIQSIHSGKWLDVALPIEDKANVKLYYENVADEDFWVFRDAGDGYVYIQNKTGYYLDLENNIAKNNSNISIYSFVNEDNKSQKWRLEDVTDYYDLEDGLYTVSTARDNGYQLDIYENQTENRANIQLYEKEDSTVQLFQFKKQGSYYVIKSVYADKWLDIKYRDDGIIGNNSNVQLWESNNDAEQHWVLENAGDGYVYIRSNADYYLDVQGDKAENNANVQVYRFANNNSQRWRLNRGEHTITYNASGGTGEPSAQTKVYGTSLTLSSAVPIQKDKYFVGWNTKEDGTGDGFKPGATFRLNEDTVLYAIWASPDWC